MPPPALTASSILVFALLCPLIPSALADPITWSGATSTDFTLGSNWTGGSPPANNITSDIATFSGTATALQPVLSGAYSVNGVNITGGGYTLSGAGTLTVGTGGFAISGPTASTISLDTIRLGANAILSWINTTVVSPGVKINNNGFNVTFQTQATSGLVLSNAVISGSGNVTFQAGSGSRQITVGGANTFTGNVLVTTTNLNFTTLANGGTASSFGAGTGDITLGGSTSVMSLTNIGAGGSTNRLFKAAANASGITITNNGTGALEFNNTGAFGGAATPDPRSLTLGGTHTVTVTVATGHSVFAQLLNDYATTALSLVKSGVGTWLVSNLNNSFTGGVTITGGYLRIAGDGALGSVDNGISFTTATGGLTATDATVLPATRAISVNSGVTAIFSILSGSSTALVINSKISGDGSVQRGPGSASATGQVRFANDGNDFTGNFSTSYGTTEFTSVANAGTASALGKGTGITIANSTSAATFRYVGSTDTTTTRVITWTATAGSLTLGNNGTGTVGFLGSTPMVTGSGIKTLVLTGTQAGNNVFAQPINNGPSGDATALTKNGSGRWILGGVNSYTGATSITAGNLQVGLAGAGSIAAGSVVSMNGTAASLSGTGALLGTTSLVRGMIRPGDEGGDSAGKLTFGNLAFDNTTAITAATFQLLSPSSYDQIDVTGALTLNSLASLLVDGAGYTPSLGDSFELLSWDSVTLNNFSVGGTRSGGNDGSNLYLPELSGFDPGWLWQISNLGSGSLIISVVVPEPGRVLLLAAGVMALGLRRRRCASVM